MQRQSADAQALPVKVPIVITIYFWIIKLCATTVGGTSADLLMFNFHFGLSATSLLMGGLLLSLVSIQLRANRYIPWLYWVTVVLVSIVGTLITDNLTDQLGVPLVISSLGFAVVLLAVFVCWYKSEGTLSIYRIDTTRRELLYWAAILFSFALGTALGDLLAASQGMGYALSALLFAGVIVAIMIGFYKFNLNAIATFWLAYILTRPLAASLGEYLSQPVINGGQGLGPITTSAIMLFGLLGLVSFVTVKRIDAATPVTIESPAFEAEAAKD